MQRERQLVTEHLEPDDEEPPFESELPRGCDDLSPKEIAHKRDRAAAVEHAQADLERALAEAERALAEEQAAEWL
jgi:hypothetical protein